MVKCEKENEKEKGIMATKKGRKLVFCLALVLSWYCIFHISSVVKAEELTTEVTEEGEIIDTAGELTENNKSESEEEWEDGVAENPEEIENLSEDFASEDTYSIKYRKGNHGKGIAIYESDTETINYVDETEEYIIKGESIESGVLVEGEPGFKFYGWKADGDDTVYIDYDCIEEGDIREPINSYILTGDTTFTAQWVEAYNITLKQGDHSEGFPYYVYENDIEVTKYNSESIETIEKGKLIYHLSKPEENEGYIFYGWKADGDDTVYIDDDYIEYGDTRKPISSYILTGDTTFTAQWIEAYNITLKPGSRSKGFLNIDFDENNNLIEEFVSQEIITTEKGGKIGCPMEPVADDGYILIGWKVDNDDTMYYSDYDEARKNHGKCIEDFIVTKDITLTAQWDKAYTITIEKGEYGRGFIDNVYEDGEWIDKYVSQTKMKVLVGNPISYLDFPEEGQGHVICGWKIDGDDTIYGMDTEDSEKGTYIYDYVPTRDIVLTAQWVEAYTVVLKDEQGEGFYDTYWDNNKLAEEFIGTTYEFECAKEKSIEYGFRSPKPKVGKVYVGYKRADTGEIYYSRYDPTGEKKDLSDFIPEKNNIVLLAQYKDGIKLTFKKGKGSEGILDEYIWENGEDEPVYVDEITFDEVKNEPLYYYSPEMDLPAGNIVVGYTDESGNYYKASQLWGGIVPKKDITLTPVFGDYYSLTLDAGEGGRIFDYVDGKKISKSKVTVRVPKGDKVGGNNYDFSFSLEGNNGRKLTGWVTENGNYISDDELENYIPKKDEILKAQYVNGDEVSVMYRTHVQSFGWQDFVENGNLSGTVGKAKRLEGIEIRLENADYSGGIQYRTHVQSYGWQNWKSNGVMSGTSGEAKRLEAIQIRLTGEMAKHYDVYYRVQAQTYGWMGWAKNGEYAGTAGFAKRLEAIQILLVKKGSKVTGNTKVDGKTLDKLGNITSATKQTSGSAYVAKQPDISYRTHVQSFGWQSFVSNGAMSGTSGKAKRLEGIEIKLGSLPYAGGVRYTTHVQTYGWQGKENDPTTWKKDGAMAGTSGEAKRLEAIRIGLYGEMAEKYDIYYRVHAQSYGWLSWAKNGAPAGTAGYAKRLEGIQIVLVEKGKPAPGKTYNGITANRNESYISK